MNFDIPAELQVLKTRTAQFVRECIIPLENDPGNTPHGPTPALRETLIDLARQAHLLSPQASPELGGLGLSHVGRAVVFEEAGYSPLGPVAMNLFAPDEGNMHLLEAIATPEQKARWLKPLAQGLTRSCFCMTEPAPGAGSDPSMLQTKAVRDGGDFLISGRKWFITGADGAAFAIIMARMDDGSATMFLSDMDVPGIIVERTMDSLDSCFPGGHCVVSFDGLRVPADAVLGEVGQGLRYAQVRLAPARLTHCMRWLGAARRAHDEALEYAREREAFGKPLGEHEGVGFMLADNAMDLHQTRLAIWHTAWVLDRGERGSVESSMTKVIASEAIFRVVDRAVQILGGQGVTGERIVERIWRDVRPFRIYDGPSEVHRWSLAKRLVGARSAP